MTSPDIYLEEITEQNRERVCALGVQPGQDLFVSSVAESLDEADATPEGEPWYRAIYCGGEPALLPAIRL
jgi:diamine N-acetyltransferase